MAVHSARLGNTRMISTFTLANRYLTPTRPIQDIREATELMSKSGCDVLISIGGGSPIDSAKAIAYNIHEETGKWIPSIAVPTTLSVAETTQNAGFTTEDKHKIAVSSPELVPKGMVLIVSRCHHTDLV
jgi:3-oxoacid CoA-transferase